MDIQDEIVQVEVIGLSTSPTSGSAFVLVLGEVAGTRKLPIIVGENEATAIIIGVEKRRPPRPMPHDLLCDLIEQMEIEVTDVLIDGLEEGTFYAKIRFILNGEHRIIDSRPSDAVAIAVRLDVDILVSESILEEAGIPVGEADDLQTYEESEGAASPIEKLKNKLARAIEEENYEEAARVRDALAKLKS